MEEEFHRPGLRSLSARLSGLLDRLQPSEELTLVVTALIVGLGTGLGAVAFRYLIRAVEWVGYTWIPSLPVNWGKTYAVFFPVIGGLLVGPMIYFFAKEAKGHGVPEVMEAVALHGGRIRPIVALIKSLASSISIGSGGSVGREGPIVQIGSALGSTLGQMLRLSDERIRNLVACGAGGGIAATFNSPIAGVIFALELILGEFDARNFISVVISAVSASVIGQAVFGNQPSFPVPMQYHINSVWEFAFYPVLAVLAGFVGVVFVRALYWMEDLFAAWKSVPEWVQPAVGGAALGGLALGYPLLTGITWDRMPQIYNVGYDIIEQALSNELAFSVVVALLVLKLLATILTLGSGGSGGVFAPSLFMGAMLGTGFGLLVNQLFPGLPAPPGAYALVGMGAVFAAGALAPITAVIILFELTGDYRIILPLMLTVVIATMLSRWILRGESIYTLKLTRRGIRLQRGKDVDVLESVRVDEIMTQDDYAVSTNLTLVELSEIFSKERHHGFPVLDERERLWGVVTVTDLERAIAANKSRRTPVTEIGTPYNQLIVAFPDDPVGVVLRRMSPRGLGRLPVVSRDDPHQLVGMVRRADVIRAYDVALARRSELAHRTRRMQRRHVDGTEFVEVHLNDGDRAIGKQVGEIATKIPDDCILVSIHRDETTLIPHGDTEFRAGDRVTAFIRSENATRLFECLKSSSVEPPFAEPPFE
jgi:CIC family chloride channel protein